MTFIEPEKSPRTLARQMLVDQANKQRLKRRLDVRITFKPLTMRHINQAVKICRHNLLVDPSVLVEAGFNPT